ncbi:MAG TPA: toluene tolerance protein [Verrucomicrobiota bacterium]|nr:toluene tolerance protein [Verrucomicrobiota bacterium]HNU49779.1 toluene tolerance protein [Verrucomicrobiota bacterium]
METRRYSVEHAGALLAGAVCLCRDAHGEKVFELPGGRIAKLFRRKRWLSSNTFLPYAKRFAHVAEEMARRGIATVDVLGVYQLPEIARQAVVYRKVEGDTLREALTRPGAAGLLVGQLADLLAMLHDRGVYFRSLHFSNLVCSPSGLVLIDILDTTFRRGPLRSGLRVRNFRHLLRYDADRRALAVYGANAFVERYGAATGWSARAQSRFVERLVRIEDFWAGRGSGVSQPSGVFKVFSQHPVPRRAAGGR